MNLKNCYSLKEIGDPFGLHYSQVSRIQTERKQNGTRSCLLPPLARKHHDRKVNTTGAVADLYGIFFTQVLRFQRDAYANGLAPFAEAGIGAVYLSEVRIQRDSSSGLDFGGNFQFENKASVGFMFGERQRYEVSANVFHYSNADIEGTSDGIDIYSIGFSMLL